MHRKIRYHRVQLIAYDVITVSLWSLPLIGSSPTPRQHNNLSLHKQFPRKIHLLPLSDSTGKKALS